MAGNTKLLGFSPDGKVQLERWGGKASVSISADSLDALRRVCSTELPMVSDMTHRLSDVTVGYSGQFGRVSIEMTPALARELASSLGDDDHGLSEDLREMVPLLYKAAKDHEEYISAHDEPGLS